MTTQLTFGEEFRYSDDPNGITVRISLQYGAKSYRLQAKIDTGSEICLFSHEVGEELDIEIETGIPISISTLAGRFEAFGHEVTIQTGEIAFHSLVYFAKYPGLQRNILGRQGWLRNIRLAVIDYDNLLYISPYDQ